MKGAERWAQKTNIWTTTDEDSELICPWNAQQLAVYFIIYQFAMPVTLVSDQKEENAN